MPSIAAKTRIVWQDRFHAPSVPRLLGGIMRGSIGPVEHLRAKLLAVENVHESIIWRGVWNWTLAYTHNGDAGPAWAYIVPDPAHPRVCVPFPDGLLGDLPTKKMSKTVRDALTHATTVDGVRWPTWDLTSKALGDDVFLLAQVASPARATA